MVTMATTHKYSADCKIQWNATELNEVNEMNTVSRNYGTNCISISIQPNDKKKTGIILMLNCNMTPSNGNIFTYSQCVRHIALIAINIYSELARQQNIFIWCIQSHLKHI